MLYPQWLNLAQISGPLTLENLAAEVRIRTETWHSSFLSRLHTSPGTSWCRVWMFASSPSNSKGPRFTSTHLLTSACPNKKFFKIMPKHKCRQLGYGFGRRTLRVVATFISHNQNYLSGSLNDPSGNLKLCFEIYFARP